MKKVNMIVDVARCHDCNNCFLSCKDEHWDNNHLPFAEAQPRLGQKWRDVLYVERGQYPLQDVCSLSYACMHCDEPTCMKAAQDGAIYKREDGIVIIDPIKAKGQKQIVDACPYKVIYWNEESQLPQKCTMCAHLLDSGEWKEPRCSFACPTGSLSFFYATDKEMVEKVDAEGLEYLHPEFGTKPRVWYKNLFRFTKCHVAGSVELHDKKECADNARVILTNVASQQTWIVTTNNYSDFKIDKLEPNSGDYTVTVEYPGYVSQTKAVRLQDSINIGVFYLNPCS
ncbi:4Fe-4S dicluster domain-containing protein [Anaerospora sp.]|jgi:Fe-S-cluster-containing dehydrogenase component|uniref:4Fe-4S dicluster domain-containing protein n=1 Tax=Anaerospora sp. TaxID=1960278 RepID=UPI00289EF2D8|nr:4Fe-4S dicluster domain-containing protein [Anaerospora sp.]